MDSTAIPSDLKARLKFSYDAITTQYNTQFVTEHDPIRLDYLSRLLSLLSSTNKEIASVQELGCGAGIPGTRTLPEHAKPNIHVTANNLSSTQVALARENLLSYASKLTLVEGDMMTLSFPSSCLDAVIGFYSIIHLPRAEQTELVKRIGN
ncbi:hypothetical protein BU26DRAFT_580919 [Trematosphaeria pertusa]|uniref:Methyltransferase domain-containing protein n=1 Tax=Trematosphaeria pertusa TaxID=390896 RepID=A0A6A6I0U9_9PLEO|nr:uncharacterized protein BU26DRAFT_580919 [Trematosphaeria pertusa]KAF2243779.1 hypothetical protein BU26DRAFT_580919 [Trematosphaeria pertusa]